MSDVEKNNKPVCEDCGALTWDECACNASDEEIEFDDFDHCSHCDQPDACSDFGCAIKNGVRKDVFDI